MNGKEKFIEELRTIGYAPEVMADNKIAFDYVIKAGRFAGKKIKVGFEVPPDFNVSCPTGPHISPQIIPLKDNATDNTKAATSPFGVEWEYLSRPYPPGNGQNNWPKTNRSVKVYMLWVNHIINTL